MAQASYQQTSFLGGEVSKFAQGHADKPAYRMGMNVCLNGFPNEAGTWVRRPGSKFLCISYLGLPARLIPFEFKKTTPYQMEFTNGTMRFVAPPPSGTGLTLPRLAYHPDTQVVVSITTANPAVVTTSAAHGWITNYQIEMLSANVIELQNRQLFITVLSPTTFSIADELGRPIDGSTLTPFLSAEAVRINVIGTPFLTAELTDVRAVQTEKQSVLLHANHVLQVLTVTQLPTSATYAEFSLSQVTLLDGPYLDPVAGSVMTPNVTTGTITLTQSGPAVNDGAGFTAADIGRSIRVFSEPPAWPGAGTGLAGNIVKFGGGYWIQQVDATPAPPGSVGNLATTFQGETNKDDKTLSVTGIADATTTTPQWLPLTVTAAAAWCWGTITGVIGVGQITATFNRALVSTVITTWRLGVYGGPNGYPTCGTYADGRLWLAGALPNRVDCSNSNDIFNFAPTLGDGTVLDSNAIAATFNSDGSNPIFWMQQDQQGILCGTQAGEWLLSSTAAGFTPTNISARRVTKIGCANIEPRRTDHTLVGVQAFKREIFEYFADVYSGKFSAPDVTGTWKHLTIGNVQEIAYQQELVPIVWARVNNALVGCTYKRNTLTTSQGPDIAAGHRHTLGSGRVVEGIAIGGNQGGTLDALYMVTNDPKVNTRHIEVFGDILDEGSAMSQAAYLDNSVAPVSILGSAAGAYGGLTFTGLWHLNGKTVSAWIGGLDCGDFSVANGQMTVPYGDGLGSGTANGLFTADFVTSFGAIANMPVVIGFAFTSQGQIVRPATPAESGARNGPAFGKKRRAHQYSAQLEGSQGVSFGTDFATARMTPAIFRQADGINPISILQPFNGIHVDSLIDDFTYDSMLCWQVTRPYPCNMVAIGAFLETMDK